MSSRDAVRHYMIWSAYVNNGQVLYEALNVEDWG